MPTLSRAGKPPGAPLIPRVADLVDAGMIKVVTTDQTKTEIAKKPRRERFPGDRRPHEAPGAGFGRRDTGREDTDEFLLPHHAVEGERNVDIDAAFTMTLKVDQHGMPTSIAQFSFDDADFIWVSIGPNDYDYK
jgi:hypothetical protein